MISFNSEISSPFRYFSITIAALLPVAIASIAEPAPVTISPPANTPGILVSKFILSVST